MDALCPCLCPLTECAPEECDPGETHEIVGDGACEIDEVEEHLAGGHGCGAEEGGERVEGVQQEEALAHEGEGGDAERQPAAVRGEPAGGGRREREGREGEDVEVGLECILHAFLRGSVSTRSVKNQETHQKLVSAVAAVHQLRHHLQREDPLPCHRHCSPGHVLPTVAQRRRAQCRQRALLARIPRRFQSGCRAYAQVHLFACSSVVSVARGRPRVRWRRRVGEWWRWQMRHGDNNYKNVKTTTTTTTKRVLNFVLSRRIVA